MKWLFSSLTLAGLLSLAGCHSCGTCGSCGGTGYGPAPGALSYQPSYAGQQGYATQGAGMQGPAAQTAQTPSAPSTLAR